MSSDGKRLIALPIASGNTAFIVPEGVETIDNSAFADNASIKSIILPEGLISIGYGAFSRLSSLSEEIVLPATLKHIGPTAFLQYNAASITLPEGLQSIGAEAFRESKLTSISMPDSVNQLGENAFLDNLFLTEAKLPAGVSTLPWGLFAGCEALRKAVIPAGVTDISVSAFGGCKDLTVHVPDSLNYIQFDAFDSMWSDSEPDLGSITLAGAEDSQAKQIAAQMGLNYVVDISERYLPIKGDGSYTSADGFEYEVKDGAVTITGIYPEGKKVVIPSEIDGCPVRALGKVYQEGESQSSIIWNDGYRELVLPEGLETINSYAFGWSSIEKINLPGTLKTIGSDVFWNTNIKSLALPASLENIGEGAFSHANKLSKLTVDKDNPHFYAKDGMLIDKRSNALIACAGAKGGTAKVPDGVATIGPYAFSGCEKLTAVTLPESVTALGEYAFAWCYKLGKVALPSGIKSLPDKAFFYCSGLNSLTLPEGLTEIGKEALGLTYKLKKLVLPASLITIGEGAFRENGLAAFEVAEGNTAFTVQDGVLFDKGMTKLWGYPNQSKAKEYAVPQGVTEMDQGVFSESKNLKKVTLPEGITVIPQSAFSGDGKNRMVIHLPDTLTTIEDYAFGRTYWGDELVLPAGVRTIGRAFEQASFKALVLPEGLESIGAYSFRWNPELIKVTLPSTLKEIPDGAFSENPNLQEVVGIEYVDMISEYAFQECPRLTLSLPKPGAAVFSGTWRLSAAVMGAMTVSPADAGMPMIIITLNEDGTGTFENEGDPAQEISWTANGSDTLAILSQPGDILMMFFTVADNKLIVEYDQMSVIFER